MTAPAGLFDEFLPPEGERGLFDEFVPKEKPAPLPKLKGQGMEVASSSTTRTVNGPPDPDSWMTAMRRPSMTEQLAGGVLGMPFAMAGHPLETAKQMAKDVVMSPARLGMYAAKKMNEPLGIATPEPFNVSGAEAVMDAANVALMFGGGLKASMKPKVRIVPEMPIRLPRAGIVRTPAEQAAFRLARAESNLRGPAVPTVGEVPLKVPFPPAEKPYPFGAAAGERGGQKALEAGAETIARELKHLPKEPAASPFAKGGLFRRPAGTPGPFDEFLPQEVVGPQELVPTAGDVPLKVPFPPAERAYPLGASTGDIRSGPRGALRHPMREPLPTPYTREGVARRTGGEPLPAVVQPEPPAQLVESLQRQAGEPVPVLPIEAGRIPPVPRATPRAKGAEPSGVIATPEGAVSAGSVGGGISPVAGTGELKTRGLSAGVEEKAIANKLTASLGELPEYRSVNMADQATKATQLLADDAGLARRVALGEAPPPADLLPESVFVAVENKALAAGDVGTLRELASGRLTEEATTMGQRIRALAERDPDSPVTAMQRIVDARVKGAKNAPAATASTVQELQQHIAKAVQMDPAAWTKFIDDLRC
jgi:hypothetical protein